MTTMNAYNPLVQTGLGSPVMSAAAVLNVWSHIQSFEQLPVVGAPTAADNLDWELVGQGSSVDFSPEGGIEIETPPSQGDTFALSPQGVAGQTALAAIVWDAEADLVFDTTIFIDDEAFDTLSVIAGFKLTVSPDITTDDEQMVLYLDATLGTIQAVVSSGGVLASVDTGIEVEADSHYRLSILTGPPEVAGGVPLARFFVNGRRVAELPASAVPTQPRIVGQKIDAAAEERNLTIRAIRIARKFR